MVEDQDRAAEWIANSPAGLRASTRVGDIALLEAPSGSHIVRLLRFLDGGTLHGSGFLSTEVIAEMGRVSGEVSAALAGLPTPPGSRVLQWDLRHGRRVVEALAHHIGDPQLREKVERVTGIEARRVDHVASLLPVQVVHGDLTTDNALIDDHGGVVGIVDFGDMSHTALVADVASVLDALGTGRDGDELFRVARLVLDGYQRITPLEPDELALLGEVWAARTAIGIAISAWRAAEGLEDEAFGTRYHASAVAMLEVLLADGWGALAERISPSHAGGLDRLHDRRAASFGPAIEPLSYDEPLHVDHGDGAWIVDVHGRRHLDAYNNVPCVGHAHPRVSGAIARASRRITTNLRYLHGGAVELAERLTATCPPSLDTVFFVNSGSEANDLAWRLATTVTGNAGGLCTRHAYHGISSVIAGFSPETLPQHRIPEWIERWDPTDTYRGTHTDASSFAAAIERLAARGLAPAMAILDGVLQSDGVHDQSPELVQELVRRTHAAGGLWVADEVQGGHGRTGEAMWSFERFGIEPDMISLGKPMGNGHPVAALITRRDIAERFAADTTFFSTFGGNQVSVAAAHAVLDVLDDERVLPRVVAAGEALRAAIADVTADVDCVGHVRGIGLANAIEIVHDRASRTPDAVTAGRIKNGLRHHGVLVGTTGAAGNVIKVRPPLAFTDAHVPVFATVLTAALTDL